MPKCAHAKLEFIKTTAARMACFILYTLVAGRGRRAASQDRFRARSTSEVALRMGVTLLKNVDTIRGIVDEARAVEACGALEVEGAQVR